MAHNATITVNGVPTQVVEFDHSAQEIDDATSLAFGMSGYNILDNADFTDPINQRGITTIANPLNGQYTIDRWQIVGNGGISFSVNPGYITLVNTTAENRTFRQALEPWRIPNGQPLTLSIQTYNGGVYSATVVTPATPTDGIIINIAIGNFALFRLTYSATANLYYAPLVVLPGQGINIVRVKLETGTKSTLGISPVESHENRLARCLYYFERIKATGANMSLALGFANQASTAIFPLKCAPKRAIPTITPANNLRYGTAGLPNTPTDCTITASSAETGHLQLYASGTFTSGNVYRLGVVENGYIDIGADL